MDSRNSPLLGGKKAEYNFISLPHFPSVLTLFFNLEIQPAHVFQAAPSSQGLQGLLWAPTIL